MLVTTRYFVRKGETVYSQYIWLCLAATYGCFSLICNFIWSNHALSRTDWHSFRTDCVKWSFEAFKVWRIEFSTHYNHRDLQIGTQLGNEHSDRLLRVSVRFKLPVFRTLINIQSERRTIKNFRNSHRSSEATHANIRRVDRTYVKSIFIFPAQRHSKVCLVGSSYSRRKQD